MGATFSSIQVRAVSQEAVIEGLNGLLKEPTYVSPAVSGWVGVYPEGAEATDTLAALSRRLSTAVLDWNVYDSDVFFYSLYETGELRDEFNSAPGYFESQKAEGDEETEEEKIDPAKVQGDPQALLPYCIPGTTPAAIQEVLHPATASEAAKKLIAFSPVSADEYLFADAQAADLARLLGMDETLAALGYRYIETGETRDYTLDQFLLMKTSAIEGKAALSLTRSSPSTGKLDTYANHIDERGEPLLVRAARFCLTESVQELVNIGAEVNMVTKPSYASVETGITALIAAAGSSIEHPTRQLETVRLLLDAGADVNARSEVGRTALAEALKMTDPARHQGKIGRRAPEEVLRQAAARSAQVVEMLRAAGAME